MSSAWILHTPTHLAAATSIKEILHSEAKLKKNFKQDLAEDRRNMVWYYPPSTSSRGRGASAAASASASDHDSREEDDPEISLPAEKRRKHSGRRVNTTATPTTTTTTTTATTSLKVDVAGTQDLSSEQVVDTPEITNEGRYWECEVISQLKKPFSPSSQ